MQPWQELMSIREERDKLSEKLRQLHDREQQLIVECERYLYPGDIHKLTDTERTLLYIIKDNPLMPRKQLADKLNVAERTIKFHLGNMFMKFNVADKQAMLSKLGWRQPK